METTSYTKKDDHTLMGDYQKGDQRAFNTLYRRHYKKLYNFACKFSGDSSVARDAVQKTFLYLLKKADEYEPNAALEALLFKVTRTNCLYYLKKKRKEANIDQEKVDLNEDEKLDNPGKSIEEQEHIEQIEKNIRTLSDDHREVLLHRLFEEFSYQKISNILDIPVGTVQSRLHYGLQKLRDLLDKEMPDLTPEQTKDET